MNCNCPNGSYGKKHTTVCYDALAARLDAMERENIYLRAHMTRDQA